MAQVIFDGPIQDPGNVKVTVTSHNHLPYQVEIPVIPQSGPYVVKDSYTLNDLTGGNGNGLMDYGESELLALALKNVGIQQATNVVVTLSTSDSYVTFTDDTETYGSIDPDQVITIADGFAFDVANNIPDGHYVLVEVSASGDDKAIWASNFTIPGHAPDLELGEVIVSDPTGNNNGKIDPGETVNLIITVENSGSSDALQVIGNLVCSDPYVTLNQTQMNYGNIEGANSVTQSYSITANANTPTGHMANFIMNISANLGITGTGMFSEVIGQVPVLILDLDANMSSGTSWKTPCKTWTLQLNMQIFSG